MTTNELDSYLTNLNDIEDFVKYDSTLNRIINELKDSNDIYGIKHLLENIEQIEDIDNRRYTVVQLLSLLDVNTVAKLLTPDNNLRFHLSQRDLWKILRVFHDEEFSDRFYLYTQDKLPHFVNSDDELDELSVLEQGERANCNANLIRAQGKGHIEEYLTPENVLKYKLYYYDDFGVSGITSLVYELDENEREKYLFYYQNPNNSTYLSIASAIKAQGIDAVRNALSLDNAKKYRLTAKDIQDLIGLLSKEEQEKYLLPNQTDREFGWRNIIYHGTSNDNTKSLILEIYKGNNSALLEYSELLANEEIIGLFSKEMISYLSCYSEGADFAKLNSKQLKLIARLLDCFKKETQSDEWTKVLSSIMSNIGKSSKLIDSIDEEQIGNLENEEVSVLLSIILDGNSANIKSLDEIDAYLANREDEIKKNVGYSKYTGDWTIPASKGMDEEETSFPKTGMKVKDLVECILRCKFGINYSEANRLVEKYGKDIDYIENEDLKVFVKTLSFLILFAKGYYEQVKCRKLKDSCIITTEFYERIRERFGDKYVFANVDEATSSSNIMRYSG